MTACLKEILVIARLNYEGFSLEIVYQDVPHFGA